MQINFQNSTDLAVLQSIAATCYTQGGRAVWQARAICRYSFFEWYEEEACVASTRSAAVLDKQDDESLVLIRVEPNPAGDMARLIIDAGGLTDDITVSIVDQVGRPIWESRHHPMGAEVVMLPVQGWSPGIYFIRVQCGHHVAVTKLIVKR